MGTVARAWAVLVFQSMCIKLETSGVKAILPWPG